jgi:uncharacterized membrane protein YfcA
MTVFTAGAIIGPLLGGALIPVVGYSWLYLIDTLTLFATTLPVLLAGLWLGVRLYGRLDDATFRKMVLVLLLLSGLTLVLPLPDLM